MDTKELVARLDNIIEDVRKATNASRTTLRMDSERHGFFVNSVVSESRADPTIKSIKQETSLQQRGTQTYKHMDETRDLVIQNDCANSIPPAPKPLMDFYGVKAQMLAPIVHNGDLVGWISVHYNPSTRTWSKEDISALKEAQRRVKTEIPNLF